tara:strand:- start:1441 stop:1800 length:360 start_codon:yes stop_codon:yes gene_type:complete
MFLLHGSIAKVVIVQSQQMGKYVFMKRRQRPSKERPDGVILLPTPSVIGGDIVLLPDVVALFLAPSQKTPPKADAEFFHPYQYVDAASPMRMPHIGVADMGVAQKRPAPISPSRQTKTK